MAYQLLTEAAEQNSSGNKQLTITLVDSALALNPKDTTRSWLMSEKTTALCDLGRMREAIRLGKEGIDFAERIGDTDGMLNMCGAVGVAYRRIGAIDSSLIYYHKGLQQAIRSNNTEYEIYLDNCISVLYNEQKRYKEAILYSDKAESKAISTNDTIERLSAHANKGAILLRQGLYQQSADWLTPLWGMVKKADYNVLTLKYLSPLLKSYLLLGKIDSLSFYMPYADEACRQLAPTSNGVLGILETKAAMLGKQGKYAEQWTLLDSINHLSNANQTMPRHKLLFTQAECLYHMGKQEAAFSTLQEAYREADSLRQSDINQQLSEFSTQYKTLEKEIEIERMSHERSVLYIRMLCLAIGLIILLIAFIISLYRRKLEKQRAELTEKTSYINGVEAERKRLAKELHDGVCNDILAVSIMMKTDKETATQLLTNVSHDVRRLSHELIPPRFDYATLPELVRSYCQSMATEGQTSIQASVSPSFTHLNLQAQTALEIYRIVQECVSNAIKYGHSQMISVSLDANDQQAILCITNDISPQHPIGNSTDGIGKETLRMRTDALKANLSIESQGHEYRVKVTIPLSQESQNTRNQ